MGDVETPGGQRTTVKPSAKTDKTWEDKQDKAASPEAAKEGSASSSDDEEWTVLSDKKPEAEAVQIPIQVLDKEVAPVTPPFQLRRAQPHQPPRGQGRGHRQGARHSPAGQGVDSGTSLGSLSAASLWSCLLETQSLYIWVPALGGHQPYNVTDLSISGQGYICTGIYVAIYISMCFLKLQFEIHWYLQKKKKKS